jgi:hypothetical protein
MFVKVFLLQPESRLSNLPLDIVIRALHVCVEQVGFLRLRLHFPQLSLLSHIMHVICQVHGVDISGGDM